MSALTGIYEFSIGPHRYGIARGSVLAYDFAPVESNEIYGPHRITLTFKGGGKVFRECDGGVGCTPTAYQQARDTPSLSREVIPPEGHSLRLKLMTNG